MRLTQKKSQGGLVVINHASHLCDRGSTLASGHIFVLNFSRSQSDSKDFSPGTPVFLPHQNRLSVDYMWLRPDTIERENLWYPSLSLN